jgi:L-alanine-DL-glutamate epimerase-like enolase superfamily enzyme
LTTEKVQAIDGYITVPQDPGLGIELDEAALGRFPGRRHPPRSLPSPADEGP